MMVQKIYNIGGMISEMTMQQGLLLSHQAVLGYTYNTNVPMLSVSYKSR
jgi:hypothetical protein